MGAAALAGSACDIELRAFGADPGDLDVDFGARDRAALVSAVLARCSGTGDAASAWALPVGARLHALVVVCALSGCRALSWSLSCPGCDERVELELPLSAPAAAARAGAAAEPAEVAWEGAAFRPRRPTGDDLLRWRAEPPSDADILAALGGPRFASPDPPAELVAAVEEALAAVDPLVDLRVRSDCPACGEALDVAVDLEREAVAVLRRGQDRLLRDVAALAAAFGWSERDVLELPERRRRRYLELLEAG